MKVIVRGAILGDTGWHEFDQEHTLRGYEHGKSRVMVSDEDVNLDDLLKQ
jgi:hypothetical protein